VTTTALVPVAPAAVARHAIAHHSKSFALASRLLGRRLGDQAAVVYTWCRRVDDAVDLGSARDGAAELARLERELRQAYVGVAVDPVTDAFGAIARDRAIPLAYPRELLAGMRMDLDDTRYDTLEQLVTYAWRVAGVVGLMMAHVFGVFDDEALVPAAHLGIGMQLTNICRDVAEDWERGRLYLPDDLLAAHGARDLAGELGAPLPASAHRSVARAVADLLAIADRYYRSGERGLPALPWRAALGVRAASRVYAAIGTRIRRADHDVLAGRAVVPRAHKLAKVAGAAVHVALSAPARWVRATRDRRATTPRRLLELGDVPRL
jgi:phytoene synthase